MTRIPKGIYCTTDPNAYICCYHGYKGEDLWCNKYDQVRNKFILNGNFINIHKCAKCIEKSGGNTNE